MKKKLPKQIAKRKAILESSIEIFAEYGFQKTKMKMIAQKANVADGTLYLYFKNKDELFMQAVEELIHEKLTNIIECIQSEKTATERLLHFFELHVELFTEKPYLAKFLTIELRQSPEFFQKYPDYKPLKDYLFCIETLCKQAIQEGQVNNFDIKAMSIVLYGTMDFLLTEWLSNDQSFSLQEMKEKIVQVLRFGFRERNLADGTLE